MAEATTSWGGGEGGEVGAGRRRVAAGGGVEFEGGVGHGSLGWGGGMMVAIINPVVGVEWHCFFEDY